MPIDINISTTFTGDTDTPNAYNGQAGKVPTVKSDETGLEFSEIPANDDLLYHEVVLNQFQLINDLHRGIELLTTANNEYLDVRNMAMELIVNGTPFDETLGPNIPVYESGLLVFKIGNKEITPSPFSINWIEDVIAVIDSQVFADGLYTVTLSGGSGTNANLSIEIDSNVCRSIYVNDYGGFYSIGDILQIPAGAMGPNPAINLPPITEFPISNKMTDDALFANMATRETLRSSTDIVFSMTPITGLGFTLGGMGLPIVKDDRGKSLWFFRTTSAPNDYNIAGGLKDGINVQLRLKIWYQKRKIGTEL